MKGALKRLFFEHRATALDWWRNSRQLWRMQQTAWPAERAAACVARPAGRQLTPEASASLVRIYRARL